MASLVKEVVLIARIYMNLFTWISFLLKNEKFKEDSAQQKYGEYYLQYNI